MTKYVFIQNEPFYLPKVLDKYLREFSDSTAGICIQSVAQGKRTLFQTAMDLYRLYGFRCFQWKIRGYIWRKLVNDLLGSTRTCYSVAAVARKYGVATTSTEDVNSDAFRQHLRDKGVTLIVSISETHFYGRNLHDQTPEGIVNCHGALLPRYRGLMPSFWTLADHETVGGVTVHFVDEKLDNGPIVIQRSYRIHPQDTLEDVMARSKDLAAEVIIEAIHLIEVGNPTLIKNDASQTTDHSMPTHSDAARFLSTGHRFV